MSWSLIARIVARTLHDLVEHLHHRLVIRIRHSSVMLTKTTESNINMGMEHPLPKGTRVLAAYHSCQTCGPSHIQKVITRITESRKVDGEYFYTLMDGREINQSDIIEVK